MLEYTTILAIDDHTVKDLRGVWPTWMLLKPELRQAPMIVIYDAQAGDYRYWKKRTRFMRDHRNVRLVAWDWPNQDDTEFSDMDQRERMLTAFVKLPPALVETPYWHKLDCDVVAYAPGPWIKPEWDKHYPSLIGPGWPYTKPAEALATLDRWALTVPPLAPLRPMDVAVAPGSEIARKQRICSWCFFCSTAFSKLVADYCPGRLPVPSQDTLHWYVAWRRGDNVVRHNFKADGWQTVHARKKRLRLVKDVMDQYAPEEGCCG